MQLLTGYKGNIWFVALKSEMLLKDIGATNHMLPNFQPITILLYPSLQIVSSSSIQPFMLHGPDLTNILNYL